VDRCIIHHKHNVRHMSGSQPLHSDHSISILPIGDTHCHQWFFDKRGAAETRTLLRWFTFPTTVQFGDSFYVSTHNTAKITLWSPEPHYQNLLPSICWWCACPYQWI
jgi:hypothetical protein